MKLLDLFCNAPTCPTSKNDMEKVTPEAPAPMTDQNHSEAYWHSVCPDYWRGCPSCPDANLYHYDKAGKPIALNSRFCRRHPRPEWAREKMQGGLLQ